MSTLKCSSGYALHFEEFENRRRKHSFKPETTFEQVIRLYEFDTALRSLLFRYIEAVEIAFRAAICFDLSINYNDPHWYLEKKYYDSEFDFARFQEECRREFSRSREIFIQRYRANYSTPELPPAWMMSEILSIGKWSTVFKHLSDPEAKKRIARHLGTNPYFLKSWMHSLSVLRNLCAHHCRIWNRNFTIRPKLPKHLKALTTSNQKLAALVVLLTHLLKPLGKNTAFQRDWDALLCEFPNVPKDKMGFPNS